MCLCMDTSSEDGREGLVDCTSGEASKDTGVQWKGGGLVKGVTEKRMS